MLANNWYMNYERGDVYISDTCVRALANNWYMNHEGTVFISIKSVRVLANTGNWYMNYEGVMFI